MSQRPRDHGVLLAIAAGGCLGGLTRYAVGLALPHTAGDWPWSTLTVNVIGAFALALLLTVADARFPPSRHPGVATLVPLLGSGVIGGFTTFSGWMLDVDTSARGSHPVLAGAYLALTLLAGLTAALAGTWAGNRAAGPPTAPHEPPDPSPGTPS